MGLLHAAMSDKEYGVILDCLYLNLCEEPRLPPNFRGSSSPSKDTMKLLADKVNTNSQILLSRTVTIIAVEIDYALLELCNGIDEESPLAHILVSVYLNKCSWLLNIFWKTAHMVKLSCQVAFLATCYFRIEVKAIFGIFSALLRSCVAHQLLIPSCQLPLSAFCSWKVYGCHIA